MRFSTLTKPFAGALAALFITGVASAQVCPADDAFEPNDDCATATPIGSIIAAVAVFSFVTAWTEYVFASVMILSDDKRPVPVGFSGIIGQYQIDWGLLQVWIAWDLPGIGEDLIPQEFGSLAYLKRQLN